MNPPFARFIGIDWTGARPTGRQPPKGIAVGLCDHRGLTRLVAPPVGRVWGRVQVVDWLAGLLADGVPTLVGFDFAFGLPWVPGVGYLDGRVPDIRDLFGLWELVEEASGDAPDHFAGPAVADPRLFPSFWVSGPTPAHWGDGTTKRRRTEVAAAENRLGTPVSVFKLAAASKQVGKASLAGMRSLRALRERVGHRLTVWPAEAPVPGRSVVAEIYPTLFRLQALGRTDKITERAVLVPALGKLGAELAPDVPDRFDDHAGDALISAAGLRRVAERPDVWSPPGLTGEVARAEGWILGVVG